MTRLSADSYSVQHHPPQSMLPRGRTGRRSDNYVSKDAKSWNLSSVSATYAIFLGLLSSCLLVSIGIPFLFQGGDGGITMPSLGTFSGSIHPQDNAVDLHMTIRRGRRLLGSESSDPSPKHGGKNDDDDKNDESDDEEGGMIEIDDEKGGMIELVHIVYTRFMQFQPDLVELGRARLEVFRTFCLPSMVYQTSKNFLWIIHADPDLDSELKEELVGMVSSYKNFLLIGSNSFPSNFQKTAVMDLLDPTKVWSGDLNLAKAGYKAAQTWPILETRLDADDGLHNYFVELVQKEAVLSLGVQCGRNGGGGGGGSNERDVQDRQQYQQMHMTQDASSVVTSSPEPPEQEEARWKMWCSYTSIEWQPLNPFPHESDASKPDQNESFGYVVGVATPYCQTPGLTIGYCPDLHFSSIPNVPHHKLLQVVPECPENEKLSIKCVKRLKMLSPASIRARTITSHGMMNVMVSDGETREVYRLVANQIEKQDVLWSGIEEFMHVVRAESARTKEYIQRNLAGIAADNLKGQCTKGHSCKHSTKEILQKLADERK